MKRCVPCDTDLFDFSFQRIDDPLRQIHIDLFRFGIEDIRPGTLEKLR